MTDEMSAVLAGLTPTVVPVDGADPELIAIGERYWAMAGFHPELGTPVWCEKTADIDTLGWGVPLYVITAGGVRAVVDHTCPECQQQLSLDLPDRACRPGQGRETCVRGVHGIPDVRSADAQRPETQGQA
ncbi:hypothetical protein ACPCSK_31190 [Streptomyces griseoincarnatus]